MCKAVWILLLLVLLVSFNLGPPIITCACSLLVEIASFNVSALPSDMSSCNDKKCERGQRERERNVFEIVFAKCGNRSFLRVSTKPLSELYITLHSLGISKSCKIKLSGYHVTEYRPWLATGISQCCELQPVIATNNVFTIPLKYVKCRSIEIISIYTLRLQLSAKCFLLFSLFPSMAQACN